MNAYTKHTLKLVGIIIALVISIAVAATFFMQGFKNRAYSLEEQVNTAHSDIEVQEKRRIDLIYNLVDCVKEYSEYEATTLRNVIEQRAVDNASASFTAIAERYPELKADGTYKELMNELSITENIMAEYRSNYNRQAKEYNRYVRSFPARTFLNMLGYEFCDFSYLEYNAPSDAPQNLFDE